MATSEGIPSSIDIEFLELNDNPYNTANGVNEREEGNEQAQRHIRQAFAVLGQRHDKTDDNRDKDAGNYQPIAPKSLVNISQVDQ